MVIRFQRSRLWWSDAFWVIPLVGVLAGLAAEQLISRLDDLIRSDLTGTLSPGAAQTMLAAVGGGMVTFTGFVFSVVLLMLQFGSSTYSPRTVGHFLRIRTTQWVLAAFLGTIVFSFLALIEVGSDGQEDYVPLFSVVVALVALVTSLLGFLALIQVVGRTLRVDSLLASIGRIACRAFRTRRVPAGEFGPQPPCPAELDPDAELIRHGGPSGQLVDISVGGLARLARRSGARIELLVRVGDGISEGVPIARVSGPSPDRRAIGRCLLVRNERSLALDPLYGLRLLVDVGLRALSPAVNDPTTAVRALDEIEGVLRTAASSPTGPVTLECGAGRLVLPMSTWPDVVDLALIEILEAGLDAPQVTRRLTGLLSGLIDDLPAERHEPLLRHRRRLVDQVAGRLTDADRGPWLTADRQGLGGSR